MIDIKGNFIYALKAGAVVTVCAFVGACLGEAIGNAISGAVDKVELNDKEMESMLS